MHLRWSVASFCVLCAGSWFAACGPEPEPEPEPKIEPIFGEIADWTEERNCRFSHEHELRYIRVVADDGARQPYRVQAESDPFPVGATLVKLQYDDENCTKLAGYTAMRKEPAGYSASGSDWRWQRLDADRNVLDDGEIPSCISCHVQHCTFPECGVPTCGFDLACGEELFP